MAGTDNQIYNLAKQFIRNLPEDFPEGILYGCVKLCGMNESSLEFLLNDAGVENVEDIKKEISEIDEIITDKGLSVDLLKRGLQVLLPILSDNKNAVSSYEEITREYDSATSAKKIIEDILWLMPSEEKEIFKEGKTLSDVLAYQKRLMDAQQNEKEEDVITEELPLEELPFDEHTFIPSEFEDEEEPGDPDDEDCEFDEEEDENEITEETDKEKGAIYSENLSNYLKELKKLIPTFKKMDSVQYLWSQSLLVSMDEGFGLSTFIGKIVDLYSAAGLSRQPGGTVSYDEYDMDNPDSKDSKYHSWESVVRYLKEVNEKLKNPNRLSSILCLDISKWIAEIDSYKVKEYLRAINEYKQSVLLIFRIPYMEYRIVSKIEASLSDVLGIKTIIASPLSVDQMSLYMVRRGKQRGYIFDEDCRAILEKGIIAEKNDGHFYGFQTLNKMFDSIVYEKGKYNCNHRTFDKKINAEQLKEFLDVDYQDQSYAEILEQMVGIDDIIKEIDSKIKQIKVAQELANKGKSVDRPSIHMMFKGSPGTGKTTIARIVAKKLKDAGILSKGNLYEIKGRDLCGRYIGETTPKTCAYCRDAYGSVLFIDEAYELYRGEESSEKDYGHEALTALVAEMENHRDDMCVILAGYSDDMDEMIKGNLGLESRIPIIIEFPNYSKAELEQIFFKLLDKSFEYEPELKDAVHDYFQSLPQEVIEEKDFSNARFVRNLFESVWGEAALRYDLNKGENVIIKSNDFKVATEKIDIKEKDEKKHRPIGFVVS